MKSWKVQIWPHLSQHHAFLLLIFFFCVIVKIQMVRDASVHLRRKQHHVSKTATWILFNNICVVERGVKNRKNKGRGERERAWGEVEDSAHLWIQSCPVFPSSPRASRWWGPVVALLGVPPLYSPSSGYPWGGHRCPHNLGQHEQLFPLPQSATPGIFVWICWPGCTKQTLPPEISIFLQQIPPFCASLEFFLWGLPLS